LTSGFNWASTSRSRKLLRAEHLHVDPMRASIGPRPRGRGNTPVEQVTQDPSLSASIGPRPRGRGNWFRDWTYNSPRYSFNWASTSRSRKPRTGRRRGSPRPRFNWASTSRSRKRPGSPLDLPRLFELQLGLDLAVEETLMRAAAFALMGMLQLGLDLAVEETTSKGGPRSSRTRCFNWASTSRSRKRRYACAS